MRRLLFTFALLALAPTCNAATPTSADFTFQKTKPGQSIGPIHLGMSIADVDRIMVKRAFSSFSHRGYIDANWRFPNDFNVDVVYRHGHVVQIDATDYSDARQMVPKTFAQLLKSRYWKLHRSVYSFTNSHGAGYVGFYFDDIRKGLCFTSGTNEQFVLNEFHPERIIVHPRGQRAVAADDGTWGVPDHDRGSRAYANRADADRGMEQDIEEDRAAEARLNASPTAPDFTFEKIKPGQSIGPIHLGMATVDVDGIMHRSADETAHFKAYVGKVWRLDGNVSVAAVYRHGRVVQVDVERRPYLLRKTFAAIIASRHWSLRCRIYDMTYPPGAGYVGYYYDDVKRGLCFQAGVQDDFILTEMSPRSIIVHRKGVRVLPTDGRVIGTVDTDPLSRPYATKADADKADAARLRKMKKD